MMAVPSSANDGKKLFNEVCFAVDLDAREDTAAGVTRDGRVIYRKTFGVNGRTFFERCEVCLNYLFTKCREEKQAVLAIGVSTKGEVRGGVIQGHQGQDLKNMLERKFHLPTEVLNRFHAAAFGVFHLTKQSERGSVAVINMSHGVGSGVIQDGIIQESYDAQRGTGGLLQVKRLSTGSRETVAKIAGIDQMTEKARGLLGPRATLSDLDAEITKKSQYEDKAREIFQDARGAVGDLVIDIDRTYHPEKYLGLVYSDAGRNLSRDWFFDGVRRYAEDKLTHKLTLEVATCSELDAKLVGVAMLAIQRSESKRDMPRKETRRFFVTGLPGCGKTTFVSSLVSDLRKQGIRVGGMITQELREDNSRTGFCVKLLSSSGEDKEVVLAKIGQVQGWKPLSRYSVCMDNIDKVIVPALEKTIQEAQVIVLDEVGGMQLLSQSFRSVLSKVCAQTVPMVITLPEKSSDSKILELQGAARRENSLITLDRNRRSSQNQELDKIIPLIFGHEKIQTQESSLKKRRLDSEDKSVAK